MSQDAVAELKITNLQAGNDFLASLSAGDSVLLEKKLLKFLAALIAQPPASAVMLNLLEQARVPVGLMAEELAQRYLSQPLPFIDEEEACFQRVISLWRHLEQAYAACAAQEVPDKTNSQSARLMATLLHRCLYCHGMVVLEHYRARREQPVGAWLEAHTYYKMAEDWGVAHTPVEDALENNLQSTHCMAAFITPLLLDIAGAYSQGVRDLNLIRRWAGMWAPLVSIHALEDDEEVPSYFVELQKDAPLHQMGVGDGPGIDARYLDTTRLGLQIQHTMTQLEQQIKPVQLGLGEDSGHYVAQLLWRIARPWNQLASPRRFKRYPSNGFARVTSGFMAMYAQIAGQEFEQPATELAYSREYLERLTQSIEGLPAEPNCAFDEWLVINHSANGYRLFRSAAGQKVAHAQLQAILPHDGESYLLCHVSWLMQEKNSALVAGVVFLPGIPKAVAVRADAGQAPYVPAFLLPASPVGKEAESLIVPLGVFMARRVIDVYVDGQEQQLRLLNVIQRGMDYERISYEAV